MVHGEGGPGCLLDAHPLAAEIAQWARAGLTHTAVNANIAKAGGAKITSSAYGRHRRFCLNIPTRLGRPPRRVVDSYETPESIPDGPVDEEALLNDALKLLQHRIKSRPHDVKTSEVVSYVNTQLRLKAARLEKDKKSDTLEDMMREATSEAGADPQ